MHVKVWNKTRYYKDCRVNPSPFIKVKKPIYVYLLGLIYSDGSIYSQKYSHTILFKTTQPDAEYFKKIFLRTGDWEIYEYIQKQHPTWKPNVIIRTGNQYLRNFLIENDFLEKKIKSPDKLLKLIPEKLHKYFYLGVSDGDGCFYVNIKNGAYRFSLASSYEQNWEYMINICDSLNIKYKIEHTKSKYGNYSKFHLTNKKETIKYRNFLYKNSQLGLKRKRDKAFSIR